MRGRKEERKRERESDGARKSTGEVERREWRRKGTDILHQAPSHLGHRLEKWVTSHQSPAVRHSVESTSPPPSPSPLSSETSGAESATRRIRSFFRQVRSLPPRSTYARAHGSPFSVSLRVILRYISEESLASALPPAYCAYQKNSELPPH